MESILHILSSSYDMFHIPNIALFVGLVIALIQCFFGYKIIRSWISIIGFLIGAVLGYGIIYLITGQMLYSFLGGIVGGILFAILAYKVYLFGIFAIASLSTYYLCVTYLTMDSKYLQLVSIAIAIVIAVLAVKYMRPAIILLTAFTGAITAMETLPTFLPLQATNTLLYVAVLGLAGTAVQFLTTKKE